MILQRNGSGQGPTTHPGAEQHHPQRRLPPAHPVFIPISLRQRDAYSNAPIANISEAMGHTIEVHLKSYTRFKPNATGGHHCGSERLIARSLRQRQLQQNERLWTGHLRLDSCGRRGLGGPASYISRSPGSGALLCVEQIRRGGLRGSNPFLLNEQSGELKEVMARGRPSL